MIRFDPDKHHRRSVRLRGYDYSSMGAYFITLCVHNQNCLLGEIADGIMQLSPLGAIVRSEWITTGQIRPRIQVDVFVVMPNHFHGILVIDNDCRGTLQRAPTVEQFGHPTSDSIPTIVRLYKSVTTKRINLLRETPGAAFWQRNYYEHIIRDDAELGRIREYIEANPSCWAEDRENPDGKTKK
jgi:REP element-mobilizing transposase RayT